MKLLKRNCVEFEYLPYIGLDSDLDENEMHTGVPILKYGDPVTYTGNISSPSGAAVQAFDGLDVRYSHVLVMDDPEADIHETGKIRYKGRLYTITAIRPSMNILSVAMIADTVDNSD